MAPRASSITYNRADLLARIDAALSKIKAYNDEQKIQAVLERGEREATWMNVHAERWLAALPKLRAQLRKGKPIMVADLPGTIDGWGDPKPALFVHRDAVRSRSDVDLTHLRAALLTLDVEVVTPTQLATLVSPHEQRAAFRTLGFWEGR